MDYSKNHIEFIKKEFTGKEKGDGKRGPLYNNSFDWTYRNDDISYFQNAVWQGYLDASRTFRGIDTTNRKAFDTLAQSIMDYLNGRINFEHKSWCESFIKSINDYNEYDCRYGQAQKVINMSFKYIYCCKGVDKSLFYDCHMPLDQYILAWYFLETGTFYQNWSYFNYTEYDAVQKKIKDILEEKGRKDVLEAELVIWNEMRNRIIDLSRL